MTCSVNHCNIIKETGDLLFCTLHREKWIEFCKEKGIHEIDVEDSISAKFFKVFIGG